MTMTYGDIREWAIYGFYDNLRKIVEKKSAYSRPYGVLVYLKDKYEGTLARGNANHLLSDGPKGERVIDLSDKKVSHNVIILLPEYKIPVIPVIGTCCFKVDNKSGRVTCLWVCPADKPTIQNFEVDGTNEVIARSAENMPIVYS